MDITNVFTNFELYDYVTVLSSWFEENLMCPTSVPDITEHLSSFSVPQITPHKSV